MTKAQISLKGLKNTANYSSLSSVGNDQRKINNQVGMSITEADDDYCRQKCYVYFIFLHNKPTFLHYGITHSHWAKRHNWEKASTSAGS